MDDPWGSPWADESPQSLPVVQAAALPGPVTPEQPLPTQQTELSPWGADDGFGDWADNSIIGDGKDSAPADKAYDSNEWEREVAKDGHEKLEDDIEPSHSSEDITSPRVKNSISPRLVLEDTEAAQDPRANVNTLIGQKPVQIHNVDFTTPSDARVTLNSLSIGDPSKDELSVESREDDSQRRISKPKQDAKPSKTSFSTYDVTEPLWDTDETQPDVEKSHRVEKDTMDTDFPLSRPSSSPSDHSNHDEVPESPRTSFEDEPKRPKLERNESSKVKQLVQLFDGLAIPEVDHDQTSQERRGDAKISDDLQDEFGDFGDFEEGDSVITAEDDYLQEQNRKAVLAAANDSTMTESPISESLDSKTEQVSSPIVHHEPVEFEFELDLSLLDSIFGQNVPAPAVTNLDARSLGIENLQETFSTIEERKVWYRISRYGTMRKYNTGEEDYVRMKWPNSKVREKTLQHVSKWMEEDRIGGGVILGGTNRFGSMFGWGDKNDAPITLESAFAARKASRRKSSKSPSRNSSTLMTTGDLNSNGSETLLLRKSVPAVSDKKTNSPKLPAVLAGAQFSWTTSQPISAVSEMQSPVFKSPISQMRASQPLTSAPSELAQLPILPTTETVKPSSTSSSTIMAARYTVENQPGPATETVPKVKASRPTTITIPPTSISADDEDEWGDMVSSPASDLVPKPPPRQLEQKSSKSMINMLSPILSTNTPTPRSHKTSTSMSDSFMWPESSVVDMDTSISNSHQSATSIPVTTSNDVWASANFSFFDTPSAPPAQSRNALVIQNTNVALCPAPQQPASFVSSTPYQKSSRDIESEEERIVKTIVNNLPDLSYMLRR